jgi:hypothetical protein
MHICLLRHWCYRFSLPCAMISPATSSMPCLCCCCCCCDAAAAWALGHGECVRRPREKRTALSIALDKLAATVWLLCYRFSFPCDVISPTTSSIPRLCCCCCCCDAAAARAWAMARAAAEGKRTALSIALDKMAAVLL